MSSAEAVTKLQNLSEERAGKVLALVEDLAELEALENAVDLKDAREALAELAEARTPCFANSKVPAHETVAEDPTIPYEQLRREVGLAR